MKLFTQKRSEMRHQNFYVLELRKNGCHFMMQNSDKQRIIFKIAIYQFVPNFVSYVSAKYYLNWFTVGEVIIAKIKG